MDLKEFRRRAESEPNFLLEVMLTSNPIEHRELMQGFGENVSLDINEMMLAFKRLKGNKDYIELFPEVPIIWENLPNGYKEALADTYIVKKSNEVLTPKRRQGIPPPENGGAVTNQEKEQDASGKGEFWNVAGVFLGGVFQSLLKGNKKQEQKKEDAPKKKDNTLWYVFGGFALLLLVVLLIFSFKKK